MGALTCHRAKNPAKGAAMVRNIALHVDAPDFVATDFDGRRVRLADYRHQRHVILVFNRGFI